MITTFRADGFDFFVTPGLVPVLHRQLRSKTFSCTAEVAHGYRFVHEQVFGSCGAVKTKTISTPQAPGLASCAIGAESASMGFGFRLSD